MEARTSPHVVLVGLSPETRSPLAGAEDVAPSARRLQAVGLAGVLGEREGWPLDLAGAAALGRLLTALAPALGLHADTFDEVRRVEAVSKGVRGGDLFDGGHPTRSQTAIMRSTRASIE